MVIWLRSHRRRPVRVGKAWQGADAQGAIPLSWCESCGREVFLPEAVLCSDCGRKER